MEIEAIIQEVQKILTFYLPPGYKAVWFGSWIRGDAAPTSDIDIGITGEEEVPWEIMIRIKGAVEAIPTLRKIDVVDLNAVSESFRRSALKNAREISL